jgi:putative SOS response-associated peptidase YedK
MCGRYATTRSAVDLAVLFEALDETGGALAPDYNVAPTDPVPIVHTPRAALGNRVLSVARWGLVPHWAKDPRIGARMINARIETVATTSAYARAFRNRRCLVPADGWYEWRRTPDGRGKQAFFMTSPAGSGLTFAGLCASTPAGLLTCTVLTAPAAGELASVHDRMPVLLPTDRWADWLSGPDPEWLLEPAAAADRAAQAAAVEIRPVGPAVGDVRNDGPSLIMRASSAVDVTLRRQIDEQPTDMPLF